MVDGGRTYQTMLRIWRWELRGVFNMVNFSKFCAKKHFQVIEKFGIEHRTWTGCSNFSQSFQTFTVGIALQSSPIIWKYSKTLGKALCRRRPTPSFAEGIIPPEIGNLLCLQLVNLASNHLTGEMVGLWILVGMKGACSPQRGYRCMPLGEP